MPARLREAAHAHYAEHFYITRGLDNCLFMFTEDEWKSQESRFKSMPFTKSQARKFNRLYFSGAQVVSIDGQGRILIPRYLKEFAGIHKDVMIIGVSNRVEIWAADKWNEFYQKEKTSFETLAENLFDAE